MKPIYIILLFSGFFSCGENQKNIEANFKTYVSDTSITHRPNFEIDFSKRQSHILNLPNITKGVDSFELRIWSFGFWTRNDLFILRYSENKWVASNYIYFTNDKTIDSLFLKTRNVSNDTAQMICNYLTKDSILNLPSQIGIPNFIDNTSDGETFYVKISTNKFYKQLRYHNPEYFDEPNNKQFIRIMDFIKSNFRIYYPY